MDQDPRSNHSCAVQRAPTLDRVHETLSTVPPRKPLANDVNPKESDHGILSPWKPAYLQPPILAIFAAIFWLLAIIVEILLMVSNRNRGLTTSHEAIHYLWTYGPTAIFTLVAAGWARVAYQAQLMAPWIEMIRGARGPERSICLDYFSMLSPVALWNSLQAHDWLVASILSVEWIIQLIIVLSTGLISLNLTEITEYNFPIELETAFESPGGSLNAAGTLAHDVTIGIIGDTLTYSDGTTETYAYQRANRNAIPAGTWLASTVDGFSAGLNCERAVLNQSNFKTTVDKSPGQYYTKVGVNLTTPSCTIDLGFYQNFEFGNTSSHFIHFTNGSCDGSSGLDGNRVSLIYGALGIGWDADSDEYNQPQSVAIANSTQVVCKPTYQIGRVDVAQNGTTTRTVRAAQDSKSRALDGLHPGSIMQTLIESGMSTFAYRHGSIRDSPYMKVIVDATPVEVDAFSQFILPNATAADIGLATMGDDNYLTQLLEQYYQKYAAQLANIALLQHIPSLSTGTASSNQNRLLVSPLVGHFVAALLIVAGVVCSALILSRWKNRLMMPADVSTIQGVASILASGIGFPAKEWNRLGATPDETVLQVASRYSYSAIPRQSQNPQPKSETTGLTVLAEPKLPNEGGTASPPDYGPAKLIYPVVLHPAYRLAICLVVVGFIIGLEMALQTSMAHDGLGDANSTPYANLLWSTLPALAFGLMSLYFSSVDFEIRALSPYTSMMRGSTRDRTIGLTLLNGTIPHHMYQAVRTRSYAALASTSAMLLASLFTIFTASLFQSTPLALDTRGSLLATTTFASYVPAPVGYDSSAPALISYVMLRNNLSYAPFTYENLAFPKFVLQNTPLDTTTSNIDDSSANLTIRATIPALRSKLECKTYDSSQIQTNLTLNYTMRGSFGDPDLVNPLSINVTDENCGFFGDTEGWNGNAMFDTRVGDFTLKDVFFASAVSDYRPIHLLQTGKLALTNPSPCSDLLYIWGRLHFGPNGSSPTINAGAVGCNETMEIVDVETTFVTRELEITAVKVLEGTARHSDLDPSSVDTVFDLGDITSGEQYLGSLFSSPHPNLLDEFGSLLTTSPYAIPVEDFGDPGQASKVVDAIRFHRGIIQTQALNSGYRWTANDSTATLPRMIDSVNFTSDAIPYDCVVTDPIGRVRVVQDVVSTRILEGLLGAVLLFSLAAWAVAPRMNVLPRGPTSIANILALAFGGNLLDHIQSGSDEHHVREKSNDAGKSQPVYWLGWGTAQETGDPAISRFGIWIRSEQPPS